jgi:hypothetical protein
MIDWSLCDIMCVFIGNCLRVVRNERYAPVHTYKCAPTRMHTYACTHAYTYTRAQHVRTHTHTLAHYYQLLKLDYLKQFISVLVMFDKLPRSSDNILYLNKEQMVKLYIIVTSKTHCKCLSNHRLFFPT